MKENKKSVGKIILSVLLAIVVAIGIFGTVVGIKEAVRVKKRDERVNNTTTEKINLSKNEKVFAIENFSITLTEDFESFEDVDFNDDELGCVAEGIEFYVMSEAFEKGSAESEMTATEYVESIIETFEGNTKLSEYNGVPLVEYMFQGENDTFVKTYKVFCYKGEECFWMVHFMVENNRSQFYKPYIYEWVDTIKAE